MDTLDAVVQGKLDADTEFQASLADLPEQEKTSALDKKRSELRELEWSDTRKKLNEKDEAFKDQQKRAAKAEKDAKEARGDKTKPEESDTISADDLYTLVTSGVHKDDIKELQKYAKLTGKGIEEALKDSTMQAILRDKAEVRKTAEAVNINGGRPANKKPSGDQLIQELSKGKVPDPSNKEDHETLFRARRGIRS